MGGQDSEYYNISDIVQYDGADTLNTETCSDISELENVIDIMLDNTPPEEADTEPQGIKVITGNRPKGWNNDNYLPAGRIGKNNNITAQRDNQVLLAHQLP